MSNAAIATLVTAALGIVAVVATFFSPTWTERKIQRRRELRAFRKAKRLIANELRAVAVGCRSMLDHPAAFGDPDEVITDVCFPMAEWEAHKTVLSESAPDQVWKLADLVYMRLRAADPAPHHNRAAGP